MADQDASPGSDEREDRVVISLRMPREVHRAVQMAAARTDLSANAWLVEIAEAASHVANAAALLGELRSMDISDEKAAAQLIQRAVDLVKRSLDHAGTQIAEIGDVIEKIGGEIESMAGAQAIRSAK